MKYPADMDPECIELCDAINALPFMVTRESCCGHGQKPYRIFFECMSFSSLYRLTRAVGHELWRIEARYWNGNDTLGFILEGPKMTAAGAGIREAWLTDLLEELGAVAPTEREKK
jgi:hypothetical protein